MYYIHAISFHKNNVKTFVLELGYAISLERDIQKIGRKRCKKTKRKGEV